MPADMVSISVGMLKISSEVRASWRNSSLTQQRTRVSAPLSASAVTSQGTQWAEGVKRLAHQPLCGGELKVARAHIVEVHVAEDVLLPVGGGNAASALADHEREFGFVVGLRGVLRQNDRLT